MFSSLLFGFFVQFVLDLSIQLLVVLHIDLNLLFDFVELGMRSHQSVELLPVFLCGA